MANKTLKDGPFTTVTEAIQANTACTPDANTIKQISYLDCLQKIIEQSNTDSLTLGELEGLVLSACFTYNKDQTIILRDLLNY